MNCIKIGFTGKLIIRDYFQENVTSRRPFLLLRISLPRRPIFIQLPPGRCSYPSKELQTWSGGRRHLCIHARWWGRGRCPRGQHRPGTAGLPNWGGVRRRRIPEKLRTTRRGPSRLRARGVSEFALEFTNIYISRVAVSCQ